MIVMKFGGTSVADAAAIRRLATIVAARRAARPIVVVSALAKVTDLLLRADRATLDLLLARHLTLAGELGVADAVEASLRHDTALLEQWLGSRGPRERSSRERDHLVAHGELWSSRIVAAFLARQGVGGQWVDARKVVVTDRSDPASPLEDRIAPRARAVLTPLVRLGLVPVTQGYIGADQDGTTTTLGRGGSDYSAALIAAALAVSRVEIWTDVDGILTADPRVVPDARLLPQSSYREAARLSVGGAKVLHPDTVAPLVAVGIPCWVGNSFHPERAGTTIGSGPPPTVDPSWLARSIALQVEGDRAVITVVGATAGAAELIDWTLSGLGIPADPPSVEDDAVVVRVGAAAATSVVRKLHRSLFGAGGRRRPDRDRHGLVRSSTATLIRSSRAPCE